MARHGENLSTAHMIPDALHSLAETRPELAHATKVWASILAPELTKRETGRKALLSRTYRRTAIALIIALLGALILGTILGSLNLANIQGLIVGTMFAGVLSVGVFAGADWVKVYTAKTQTKELVMTAACGPFGFTYDTLRPDLEDIHDFKSLFSKIQELALHTDKTTAGLDSRTLNTPFGEINVPTSTISGPPPPTPAYEALRQAELLPGHDKRAFEDLISGERAGAAFTLVEATLTDTSGDNSSVTFQGFLLHIEYPERFLGRTLLARSKWWKRGAGARDLQRVKLVSQELERAFTVYSTDQVEARALLTPDRMERLIALEKHFSGGKLRGVFEEGHMTLALEAPDQFEAGSVFHPLVEPQRYITALKELGLVCDLIDGFLTREWVQDRIG